MKYSNENWNGFKGDVWRDEINVRDFIQSNYTPYDGDESFLVPSSEKTRKVWNKLTEMFKVERERGVYDAETKLPQTITTYGPGYIDKENEVVLVFKQMLLLNAVSSLKEVFVWLRTV